MAKVTIRFEGPGKDTLARAVARRLGPDAVLIPTQADEPAVIEIEPGPAYLAALRAENGEA